ncbi:DUF2474 family protein [Paroceanicella profunda]|uniref:DUF2474 family protein n=1 Tax=Paroceanicella profunda TaxID=2579971 RepID=A0A5B8FG72_9RHOB|nr:DUF2474 family protein [Paroceanicella profunda]QDL90851.1 DUF2474 family protein [Paroceanicella profunda]
MSPCLRKSLWFLGLWAGGVLTLGVIGLAIRAVLF